MTKKQTILIALMCAVAAVLAALMLWRAPGQGALQGHDAHADSHGHDDRHAEAFEGKAGSAEEADIALTEAQIRANGIGIERSGPALIRERLHLPAQIKVDAERTVALAPPAAGMVQSVPVSAGAAVRQGQPLVVIQSPEVAQWRADEASARQRLALARTTYQREKTLWEQRISARQDLDAAQAALKEAEFGAQASRQRLAAFGIAAGGPVSGSVIVRAPFGGVVLDKPVVAGQAADPAKALLTIADLSRVWVEAAVPAESLSQLAVGMPARVSVNAQPQESEGKLAFIGPVLGEATRMATARVELSNPGLRLRPGMLASVDLLGQQASVPVTVANGAIQTIHERSVVFVRTAGGFRPAGVTLGRTDGKRTEIVDGLAAGAHYAASGSFLLKAELGKAEAEHH